MAGTLEDLRLDEYAPTQLDVDCRRCKRHASVHTGVLKGKYGNATLGEVARGVAGAADPPCNLAGVTGSAMCSAVPIEPPVDHWADLGHALHGGWRAYLHCHRRHSGLKATKSCPGPERLDVRSVAAVLGHDFPLERLKVRLQSPGCFTKAISIEWEVPPPPPPPEPVSAPPTRLLPSGETLHRPAKSVRNQGLRVIGRTNS